jgi:hypothetical protein
MYHTHVHIVFKLILVDTTVYKLKCEKMPWCDFWTWAGPAFAEVLFTGAHDTREVGMHSSYAYTSEARQMRRRSISIQARD